MMNIGIFCSANNQIDAVYFEKTAALGQWLAQHGYNVVFGGCNLGLMECLAKAVYEAGGQAIGVVPEIIEQHGRISEYATEVVTCKDLNDRKAIIMEQSDVFVALPGGIGTLDELFTVAAAHTIGYHHKKMILYNINGFWNKLADLLDDLNTKGVIRGNWRSYIPIVENLDELKNYLEIHTF